MANIGTLTQTARHGYTDVETARLLGISAATTRRWRLLGQGPKFRKFGGAVRYMPEDIEAYIQGSESGGMKGAA